MGLPCCLEFACHQRNAGTIRQSPHTGQLLSASIILQLIGKSLARNHLLPMICFAYKVSVWVDSRSLYGVLRTPYLVPWGLDLPT